MAPDPSVYEKLGTFYLGSNADGALVYDAKNLTTHGVCVGMTGSGKTGLCMALLEEAAIDGIPIIAVDPKGDLSNLMLTFPKLRPDDFAPWIDAAEATRAGRSSAEQAQHIASLWLQGLRDSGQTPARIKRLRDAVELRLYTPGSMTAPLSLLRSLAAPSPAVRDDDDALRQRAATTVSGMLALLGHDADALQSREHILLATLLETAWRAGATIDLPQLIAQVLDPPISRVGVLDLETFFPKKARRQLAMSINNLLASPSFAAWLEGDPLDVQSLLWRSDGKPRVSILSIAHLSDRERMFFVTQLLGEIVSWTRTQPGTSSLRAILYMDEVFGFFPPVANPPSKRPMLTLLKQARACGLGVLLATQNPVDLDYKGLSNCGTWFVGRLQTERDVGRLLDGLQSSGSAFARPQLELLLSGLQPRSFLLKDPARTEVFRSRWALSYLRGPLATPELARLAKKRDDVAPAAAQQFAAGQDRDAPRPLSTGMAVASGRDVAGSSERPALPDGIEELFRAGGEGRIVYRPGLLATVALHYAHRHAQLDAWLEPTLIVPLGRGQLRWEDATWGAFDKLALRPSPIDDAVFALAPKQLSKASLASAPRKLKSHILRNEAMPIWYCRPRKMWSGQGESQAEFVARAQLAVREQRDLALGKVRRQYDAKFARLREKIRKAEQRLGKQRSQVGQQKFQAAVSVGSSVLGALFGGKGAWRGGVTSTARRTGRVVAESGDVERAAADLHTHQQQLWDLEVELSDAVAGIDQSPVDVPIEENQVRPRKGDFEILRFSVLWSPWRIDRDPKGEPAWL